MLEKIKLLVLIIQSKKTGYNGKFTEVENKITNHKHDECFAYFIGKSHFEEDGVQNYLVFQLVYRYFKFIANTNFISEWISKGLSSESIKPPASSDNNLTPAINNYGTKKRVKFTGSFL